MNRIEWWIEKGAYIAIAFVAIVFFYVIFKVWSEGKFNYFLFTGDFQSAGVVLGIMLVLGWMLKKFWKWELHSVFHPRQKRRGR